MMRSANPTLQSSTFSHFSHTLSHSERMTIQGTVTKSLILLLLVFLTAGYTWSLIFRAGAVTSGVSLWMIGGAIVGFIVALVTIFKKAWSPITAPIYAVAQGFFVGGLSAIMESSYPGIVIQAVSLTFGTLFIMLAAYRTGLIKATEKFKLGVVAATGGIALVYFVSIILSFFNIYPSFIYGSTWVSIGFSLFVVIIAALNFVIDFDFIEHGANLGAPKYMEWYGAFALMVTLIWLYIEFLRLLSKTRSR